jgi:hypothetical protein
MGGKWLHEITDPVEQVCFLAARDGSRVDLSAERSENSATKIQAALDAGAIDSEGWLTAIGREYANRAADESDSEANHE